MSQTDDGKTFSTFTLVLLIVFGLLGLAVTYGTTPETKLGNPRFAGEYLMGMTLLGGMGMAVGAAIDGFLLSGKLGALLRGGAVFIGMIAGLAAGFTITETAGIGRITLEASVYQSLSTFLCASFLLGIVVAAQSRKLHQAEFLLGSLAFFAVALTKLATTAGGFRHDPGSSATEILTAIVGISLAMSLHGLYLEKKDARQGAEP